MCDCDYNPPTLFIQSERKARKEHKCCECKSKIVKGETYVYTVGVWDHEFDSFKQCLACCELSARIENELECPPCYGQLISAMQDSDLISYDRPNKQWISECDFVIIINNKPRLKTDLTSDSKSYSLA